jgi:hypothetical protein
VAGGESTPALPPAVDDAAFAGGDDARPRLRNPDAKLVKTTLRDERGQVQRPQAPADASAGTGSVGGSGTRSGTTGGGGASTGTPVAQADGQGNAPSVAPTTLPSLTLPTTSSALPPLPPRASVPSWIPPWGAIEQPEQDQASPRLPSDPLGELDLGDGDATAPPQQSFLAPSASISLLQVGEPGSLWLGLVAIALIGASLRAPETRRQPRLQPAG